MKTALKLIGGLLAMVVLVIAALLIGARFADGPLEIVAGGPFTSGEAYDGPEPDWSFVRDLPTVEFQLAEPARSRVTWIIEHDGRIYIPCGYMETAWGRIWKQWPIEAERDGRAILRVNGKLYDRQLVRRKTGPAIEPVLEKLAAKYHIPANVAAVTSNSLWLFELTPAEHG